LDILYCERNRYLLILSFNNSISATILANPNLLKDFREQWAMSVPPLFVQEWLAFAVNHSRFPRRDVSSSVPIDIQNDVGATV
jgi:hypothetical protein